MFAIISVCGHALLLRIKREACRHDMYFHSILSFSSDLKHLRDVSENRCEMKRTRHIFRDFLFDGPMLGLGSNIANESLCSNACLGFPMCLNEIVGDERVWYGVSPTRSYGAIVNLPQNEFACVKICQAGMKLPNMFL